jgi:hypothetical protein
VDGAVTATPPLGEDVGCAPLQAPEAAQEVAPLTAHFSLMVPPGATVLGEAASAVVKTGADGGGLATISAALAVAVSPLLLPVQVRV